MFLRSGVNLSSFKKYLYKYPNKSITSFALIISELTCSIYNDSNIDKIEDYRQQYIKIQKLKLPIINNFNFCIFDFSLKRWRKIFIYLVYLFIKSCDKNKRYFLYIEILVFMYKRYIQNKFSYKEHKHFINLLTKLIIYVFMNNCLLKIGREPNGKQNNIYVYIIDVIISEWNLIYPHYQLIIKQNIGRWIKKLQQQGYNNLHNKNVLLNIILKLK